MVLFFPPFPLSPLPAPRVSALLFGRWEESDGDFPGKGGLGWDGMVEDPSGSVASRLGMLAHPWIRGARMAAGGTAGRGTGVCRELRARIYFLGRWEELEFPWERCPEGTVSVFFSLHIVQKSLFNDSGRELLPEPMEFGKGWIPPRITALWWGTQTWRISSSWVFFPQVLCKCGQQKQRLHRVCASGWEPSGFGLFPSVFPAVFPVYSS